MRNAQGYGITKEPGKADVEEDSFTCSHCNFVVFVKPKQDPAEMGGFCKLCMKHTCASPKCLSSCDVFEKKLLRMESRGRFLQSVFG